MNTVKVSFLGLGVVGSKLIEYVRDNIDNLEYTLGLRVQIDKIYVRDLTKKRAVDITGLCLTQDPYEALQHADIVIECMGGNGTELTRELVLAAIRRHKSVIMSSKKCLAKYGREITEAVNSNNSSFFYDATVGGGIPISSVFKHMGKCEMITKIYGICNATSNFILDDMRQYGSSYEEALRKAQTLGYTENNPSEDVDGYDALYKAVIMAGFGMNVWLDPDEISPISIKSISINDIKKQDDKKCIIKPVFILEYDGEQCTCHVRPQSYAEGDLLAYVKNNNNIIFICGSESGERAFYGQGAGAKPTASAMYDDLIKTLNSFPKILHSI